jgi:hypothetical protein
MYSRNDKAKNEKDDKDSHLAPRLSSPPRTIFPILNYILKLVRQATHWSV